MREKLEFWLVLTVARPLGWLPRGLARRVAGVLAWSVYRLHGRLRRVGERNLELAFPELSAGERKADSARRLPSPRLAVGRVLPHDPLHRRELSRGWMRTEGLDHYLAAKARGKGVLIVTGHLGAWELSSFYHSLMGHPMSMVMRPLDNQRLDEFVNGIRCLHGNRVLPKDDFARGPADRYAQGRDGGHSDGHEYDAAAGRLREVLREAGMHGLKY